ncbi:protein ASPARTIC PROTEASE IN GUARD CELL 1 [Prunus yedoensis var. nudiflora]|uniref:Protein ASPARTIC PROTEASE IN GUARD CELL 1 n=1 Tax=Prunus yedoensis var. nudiflora TaxID=2094558 RepID=A0A314YA91_PRUYE|nr:protein ASPARTIC PROTEASE IN GUARD CELL 1 [Prunus yedoensis var. nudiflora]
MKQERERKKQNKMKTRIFKQEETIRMVAKASLILVLLVIFSCTLVAIAGIHNHNNQTPNGSTLAGIELPEHMSFNAVSSSSHTGCSLSRSKKTKQSDSTMKKAVSDNEESDEEEDEVADDSMTKMKPHKQSVKLHLRHRSQNRESERKSSVIESTVRDLVRIQTLHTRIVEKKNQNTISRLQKDKKVHEFKPVIAPAASLESYTSELSGQLQATLKSGVSLGSGEYFMDVFIARWTTYDPKDSTSFRDISCQDQRCRLVSSPDPPQPCKAENQTCPYFYWYGDSSNTTGEFSLETFTVNLTSHTGKADFKRVENVMFGCGHWNRGLFHGAAGLLGLGRGPLSFASQLQSLYGHSFSYCLVDRNSDTNVSSKLIFGEDNGLLSHPKLRYTSLVGGKENPADTFYYVQIKSIMVGGEVVDIPEETWNLTPEGAGGTIIDSGTTLSYFADPAYQIIKEAFSKKVKGYPVVKDFPFLDPCYNVSGVEKIELPEFAILFADGAVWDFPVENYFIQIDPQEVVCLAVLGTPKSGLSIIGNYQQQNFHILYDTKKSRLGYVPMKCADV